MKNNFFEIIAGTVVLLIAIFFFIFLIQRSDINIVDSYNIEAEFNNVDGISIGSDVKISGVNIGNVSNISLDKKTYKAKVVISLDKNIELPIDSSAKIASSGLLGGKFLSIEIGSDTEILLPGESIDFTQSSVNFEDLLGKFIFNSAKGDK